MKFLAVLKDSLREAIDNKVLYVMVGLSLLLTLFALSLTFRPLPAQQMMSRLLKGEVMRFDEMGGGGGPRAAHRRAKEAAGVVEVDQFAVKGVEALRGAPDEPESEYRVTVVLPLKDKEAAEKVRRAPAAERSRLRGQLANAEKLDYFTVRDVRLAAQPGDGPEVFFEVTTEPTAASRLMWGHEYSLFWGAAPLGGGAPLGFVLFLSSVTVLWLGSLVTLLVSVIITAFFIPNMVRKGTVDLLLVKPVSRWTLLLYKYVGGLTFIFINTAVAVLGLWLALGLRSGVWANSFLLMIFVYTFFFAILYAVSALFAVLTRSTIVAILMTVGAWFVFFLAGVFFGLAEQTRLAEERENVPEAERTSDNAFWGVVRAVHFVLPRTSDLDNLGNKAVMNDFLPPKVTEMGRMGERPAISWGESLSVSCAFIAVMLGLACWRFSATDY